MRSRAGGLLWLVGAWLLPVPIALLLGVDATVLLLAYGIWLALLFGFGLSVRIVGGTTGESVGWPLIFSFFWTIPVVGLLTAILLAVGSD